MLSRRDFLRVTGGAALAAVLVASNSKPSSAAVVELEIGAIKADDLYCRVFVADEVRTGRGEEFWSKSYHVINADFVLPQASRAVSVWCEKAHGLCAVGEIDDYLLLRLVAWTPDIRVQNIWFKLVAVSDDHAGCSRTLMTLERVSGGQQGALVSRGSVLLNCGEPGGEWIHLSALSQDDLPSVQIGRSFLDSDMISPAKNVQYGDLRGVL